MLVKEIEAIELNEKMISSPDKYKVIDVRESHEVAQGTIPGATHIPLKTLPFRLDEVDSDKPVVFLCHSGQRSAHACMFMEQQGYKNTINLRGGVLSWAYSGFAFAQPQLSF